MRAKRVTTYRKTVRAMVATAALGVFALSGTAMAHTDPPGASGTGVDGNLLAYRADGTTTIFGEVPFPGVVSPCETLKYNVVLKPSEGQFALESGALTITTPDGVVHDVHPTVLECTAGDTGSSCTNNGDCDTGPPDGLCEPVAAIPCLGGTVDDDDIPPVDGRGDCAPTTAELTSATVTYVVSPGDLDGGFLKASWAYTDGFAHQGPNDASGVSGGLPFNLQITDCGDDGLFCNGGSICDDLEESAGRTGLCVDTPAPPCSDADACTQDNCSEGSGTHVCANPPIGGIDDGDDCTQNLCDDGSITNPPIEGIDDGDGCTQNLCDDGNITNPPIEGIDDGDDCTQNLCDDGSITNPPIGGIDDGDECTDDSCLDGVISNDPVTPVNDADGCTEDTCDSSDGSTDHTPVSCDPDEDICTNTVCSSLGDDAFECEHIPIENCGANICRTAGFWGSHAGNAKRGSHNIVQDLIDEVGQIEICGEVLLNTDADDAASAVEALRVRVKGQSERQLARQLAAAALGCIISGNGADCEGNPVEAAFADCQAACAGEDSEATVNECISAIDCHNNGDQFFEGVCYWGTLDEGGTLCNTDLLGIEVIENVEEIVVLDECIAFEETCHDRQLVNEELELDYNPPGPAGSTRAAKDATKTECTIIQPNEDECDKDSHEDL